MLHEKLKSSSSHDDIIQVINTICASNVNCLPGVVESMIVIASQMQVSSKAIGSTDENALNRACGPFWM